MSDRLRRAWAVALCLAVVCTAASVMIAVQWPERGPWPWLLLIGWISAWLAALAWPAKKGDHLFVPGSISAVVAGMFWSFSEVLGNRTEAKLLGQLALLMGGAAAGGLLGRAVEQQRETQVKKPNPTKRNAASLKAAWSYKRPTPCVSPRCALAAARRLGRASAIAHAVRPVAETSAP